MNLQNIPDAHSRNRAIPAGRMLLCEGRIPEGEPLREDIVLDAAPLARRPAITIRLVARLAGWTCAGSVSRWDNGSYAVAFTESDGTRHSRVFRTLEEALALFTAWTTPQQEGDSNGR